METAGSDRVSSFSEVTSHTSGTVSINDNIFHFHVSNFKDQENHTLHCPIHLEVPVDSNYLGLPLCVPICNKVLATATLNIKIYIPGSSWTLVLHVQSSYCTCCCSLMVVDSHVISHYWLSVAVAPGHYGQLLNVWERPRGIYPVSMAMLELLLTMTTPSDTPATTDDQLACVVFVMREMFAGYHKWRYRSVTQREEMGTQRFI